MPCDVDFEQLIATYRRPLTATAYHLCGDKEAALDIVQETLLDAYRGIGGLRDASRAGAWLFAILRRKASAYHRSKTHESELTMEPPDHCEDELAAITRGIVIEQLEQLPQDDREILAGKYLLGLSYREISESMGLSEGAIRVRCLRAKERLRKALRGTVLTDR